MTKRAYDHVVGVLDAAGLARTDKGAGRSAWQAPGHSPADRSLIVTDGPTRVLLHCHSDSTSDVMATVGLVYRDLYDERRVDYWYDDGRVKHRATAAKGFSQSGNRRGPGVLYRLDRLRDATVVHFAEGEEDVHALEVAGVTATCTASTSGRLPDLGALHGKSVIVWRDKDKAGEEYAARIVGALDGKADVCVVEALSGKDASDHLAAGHSVDDAVPVESFTRKDSGRQLRVVRGDEVRTKRVQWWETDLIPRASLTLLAGREGLGKSTVACSWAARETNAGNTILYLHSEDSREHTVAPRLKAAGADMSKVLFLDVQTEYSDTGTVVLPLDTDSVEKVIVDHRVTFMVLDAATSSMSSELSGRDDREVRRFLEPLAQLAARRDLVVMGLVHFGKRDGNDTGKLILGSIAWSQVARSVLSLARDDDSGELVLTNTKGNLAPRTRSVSLRIRSETVITDDGEAEVGAVEWLGDTDRDARELLADTSGDSDDPADRTAAEAWLRECLTQSPGADSAEVKKAARAADIADRTLQRARKKLGIIPRLEGRPPRSYWSLPDSATSGKPDPIHVGSGKDGKVSDDLGKQSGKVRPKPELCHSLVHGKDSGKVSGPGSADRCAACSDPIDEGLFGEGLCCLCTASLGYVERALTRTDWADKGLLVRAHNSDTGSRDKIDPVLGFLVKSGRIAVNTSSHGTRVYKKLGTRRCDCGAQLPDGYGRCADCIEERGTA